MQVYAMENNTYYFLLNKSRVYLVMFLLLITIAVILFIPCFPHSNYVHTNTLCLCTLFTHQKT